MRNTYEILYMDKEMNILGERQLPSTNLASIMYSILAELEKWPVGTENISINLKD